MLIQDVSTVVVDAGDRDWVFVRVRTDEPGLVGWGEASLGWHTRAVSGAVADLEPLLVGQDPRAVERLWQVMARALYFRGGLVVTSAISGIDQALWDIKAKALGVPLFELLGGPVRDRVRTYVNLGSELGGDAMRPEAWANAARAAREAGFDAMKLYPMAPARPLEGVAAMRRAEELVRTVREAAGDDADIMVDLHGRTTPALAILLGRMLEPLRPYFLEEPCQPGDVHALLEVARALRDMVSVHLALALPNFLILEQVRNVVPWRSEVVDRPLDVHDGYVQPPTRPGIGLELVEKVAAAHPGKSPPPHLATAPDGSLLDW